MFICTHARGKVGKETTGWISSLRQLNIRGLFQQKSWCLKKARYAVWSHRYRGTTYCGPPQRLANKDLCTPSPLSFSGYKPLTLSALTLSACASLPMGKGAKETAFPPFSSYFSFHVLCAIFPLIFFVTHKQTLFSVQLLPPPSPFPLFPLYIKKKCSCRPSCAPCVYVCECVHILVCIKLGWMYIVEIIMKKKKSVAVWLRVDNKC